MAAPDIVMYEEEFNQIKAIISKLRVDANAKVVFLVDKNGQQIAAHGEIENLDTTSLASLTAGNVAATDGLARLIGEKEFSILFHEGETRQHPHLHRRPAGDPGRDLRRALLARPGAPAGQEGVAGAERRVRPDHGQGGAGEVPGRKPPSRAPSPRSPTRTSTACSASKGLERATDPMTFINYASREINCKIVYYGPGLCGKTTNLQ